MTRPEVRQIYNEACHGAGASVRWAARDRLEQQARDDGVTLSALLERHDCDLAAWFASMPISRPVAAR